MSANVAYNELRTEQRRALATLLDTGDVAAAAVAADRTERTIYRWLSEDDFQTALAQREGVAIDEATRRLVRLTGKAIAELERILDDETTSDTNKRLAAQTVLDNMMKLRELRNVEQRLAKLEDKLL